MMKIGFVLVFDVPTELGNVKRQTHRLLIRIGAKQIQRSVWKSEDLKKMVDIASFIKQSGGKAMILEERLAFQ